LTDKSYSWKRLWYPRTSTGNLLEEYTLHRSDVSWLHLDIPVQGQPFEAMAHIPCLILLGELGIGKTRELKQQESYTREHLSEKTLLFDLSGYQNETELRQSLIEDPRFQAWLTGTHSLHLFLDSFDEGLLTMSVLSKLLSRIFTTYHERLHRLFLRITCRATDWPKGLEESLQRLWGAERVAVYRMAPLQLNGIREAAIASGIPPDQFLDEINRKAVMPFAIRPLTLEFLINLYRSQQTFPSTKAELYLEGFLRLCTEREERRDAGFTGMFSPQQRLLEASRLAFLMLFANQSEFRMDIEGDVPSGNLTLNDCWGETETAETLISENPLREALASGLFSPRGQKRLG
jgi:predicted NACHT family NTPase